MASQSEEMASQSEEKQIPEDLKPLYKLGRPDPQRTAFLDELFEYLAECNKKCKPVYLEDKFVDLYYLYKHVRDNGGYRKVTKSKIWEYICILMGFTGIASNAKTLQKYYYETLFCFEVIKPYQPAKTSIHF